VTVAAVDNASTVPGANGDPTEATLDVETVAGLAPGANIALYVMPSLASQFYNDAFNQIITDGKATIVSLSFAGCESASSPGTATIIARAVQAGIAFVSASGDQGSSCFAGTSSSGAAQYALGVGYPASDPNVIAVGGNETVTALTSPVAWNDALSVTGQQLASGGGVSTTFTIPAYQAGVAGLASAQFRNVPDLAMPAVNAAVYLNGRWQLVEGTSWASPQFAVMLAEVSQYCRSGLGNAAAIPYGVYRNGGAGAFLDITSGNNAVPFNGGTSPAYAAVAGYDNVTGFGVPLGAPFARAFCPGRAGSARWSQPAAAAATTSERRSASTLVAVPSVRGLADLGRRSAIAQTRIQLILAPAPTLAASESNVIAVLQTAGFSIERTFSNHLVVDATAGSAAIERLFDTTMHDVAQGRHGTRYLPVTPVTVPASLAAYVTSISLDDVVNAANPIGW
jgi:subtilase family serine protease